MNTIEQLMGCIRSDAAQNSMKSTVIHANSYAKEFFENYYLTVYKTKAELITDPQIQLAFSDYRTGYQKKMNDWLRNSGNPVEELKTSTDSSGHKTSYLLLIVGSVISFLIALCARRIWWLSILAEILVLALFYNLILKENYSNARKKKELELQQILDSIQFWIDNGIKYSDSVLNEFGIE